MVYTVAISNLVVQISRVCDAALHGTALSGVVLALLLLAFMILLAQQLHRYTVFLADSPATYLRMQLFRPTVIQRVYRELMAMLFVRLLCYVQRMNKTKTFLLRRDTMERWWFRRGREPLLTIANHTSIAEIGAMAVLVRPLWYTQHAFYVANMKQAYGYGFLGRHMSMVLRMLAVDSKQTPDDVDGFMPSEDVRRRELLKFYAIGEGLFRNGQWVHIYPEGRIWQSHEMVDGSYVTRGGRRSAPGENVAPFQLGAALLLCVASVTPLVHVFTNSGFDEVVRYVPPHQRKKTENRTGRHTLINFGDGVLDFSTKIAAFKAAHGDFDPLALTEDQTRFLHELSDTMRARMVAMKREGDTELRRLLEAKDGDGDPLQ